MALILIVEDNVSIAKIWSLKLTKEGYEVDVAKTGKEALAKVCEKKPQLILMDVMMPGISGIEVFQQIRQNIEYSRIPVIFLTSSIKSKDEVQKILDMGAADFMAKPEITPEQLAQRIKEVLSKES